MPNAKDSVAAVLFGSERQRYVCLTVDNASIWATRPRGPLSIPRDWREYWFADYRMAPWDFMPRKPALIECAANNSQAMLVAHDGIPGEWTLVFALGPWLPSSTLVCLDGQPANLIIDTALRLVRPTAAEVREVVGKAVAHA